MKNKEIENILNISEQHSARTRRPREHGKFYYFYEVGTSNKINGTSRNNKLWIDTNQHSIKGNVSNQTKNDYYIVTDVLKNSGKIYNLKKQ